MTTPTLPAISGSAPSYPAAARKPPGAALPVRVLAALGPDFSLTLAFLTALAALVAAFGASFVWAKGPILWAGGILTALVVIALLSRLPAIARGQAGAWRDVGIAARAAARDWGPFTIIMWAFESMETYTGAIRKTSIDDALYRMDLRLFGVEPTVWAGRFHHPLLTDWMSLGYGLYFVLPMAVAAALSLRGRRRDLRELSTAVILQMGLGFLLFLLFPAGPPRFYPPLVAGVFDPAHLRSWTGLYEMQQNVFDAVDPLRVRSAFPSLHCSIGLLTLFYSWRFGDALFPRRPRLYFWICLPLVVSLWLSTIYLRHHWVPDIAAGLALGLVSATLAPRLRRAWPRLNPATTEPGR
ncbi:MAG TPA: phosphatase PAP2 family protein [Polyangia bacterium]|nr:phosphatase PAP2 family protein [Polyangia bacterium]